jgi:hypothetical protein
MNIFIRNIKSFQDVMCIKLQKETNDNGVIFYKDNQDLYDCIAIGPTTNIGFRIAYLLWILKGANTIEQLNYYSDHLSVKSDDDITLRGAYGPRLRNWIGADQLQEAINKNKDVDDVEDFCKPKGVDQLESIYNDFKNGMNVSSAMIFNPGIDFDNSKDIPDLLNIVFFKKDGFLHLNVMYAELEIDFNFVNDYFFITVLHHIIANLVGLKPGVINFNITKSKISNIELTTLPLLEGEHVRLQDTNSESLWKNLFLLYGLEKHIRCNINKDSIEQPDVELISCCNKLKEKFIDNITCPFWKELGYILMIWALKKYDKKFIYTQYIEDLRKFIVTPLGKEV